MTSEALPIGQIITVLIFLASLLAALYFVRRHGTGLRQHFTAARRAQIVSELSLGPQERLRIVQIDHREYVIISGRNGTPAFFALPAHGARTQSPADDGYEMPKSLHAFVPPQKTNVTRGAEK
ncbi:MAG: flagellar biosynthetic protein FliO [Pseudomonadota bacterium]|nr:flagellar biosynthetic protein FliO [Pseudomonadota bacterium]